MSTDVETTVIDEKVDKVRPLNASQARALRDLVNGDFAQVASEIEQMSSDEEGKVEAIIRQEYAERLKDADDWERQGRALVRAFDDDRQTLKERARDAGVTLGIEYGYRGQPDITAEVNGLDRAIRDAKAQVWRNARRALNMLERQRLTAQRRVLQASLTAQAEEIATSIPSAREMLINAQEDVTRVLGP